MKADHCLSQLQIEGLVLEVREARLAMTWSDPAGWVGLGRPLLAGWGRGGTWIHGHLTRRMFA